MEHYPALHELENQVPPSGGSLEIGNDRKNTQENPGCRVVPPSGGSLEIGNGEVSQIQPPVIPIGVPPSGGSLEIGNSSRCCFTAAR